MFLNMNKGVKTEYKVTDTKGVTHLRKLNKKQKDRLEAEGCIVKLHAEMLVDGYTASMEAIEKQGQKLRYGRFEADKPFARVISGTPTGPGSAYTHFEQHVRQAGQTRGKKQKIRFPRTEVNSRMETMPIGKRTIF